MFPFTVDPHIKFPSSEDLYKITFAIENNKWVALR